MRSLREIRVTDLQTESCRELTAYWESKRTGPDPPRRGDLDPPLEKPHLIHVLFIEQVVEGGHDFRKRLVGTNITEVFDSDPTGKCLSDIWRDAKMAEADVDLLLTTITKCVEAGLPTAAEGSFDFIGKGWVEWEVVFAPLRLNDNEIKQVIGCVGWLAPDSLVEQEQALRDRAGGSHGHRS